MALDLLGELIKLTSYPGYYDPGNTAGFYLFFWITVWNAVTAVVGGLMVLVRDRQNQKNRAFALFSWLTFFFMASFVMLVVSVPGPVASFWVETAMVASFPLSAVFLYFTLLVLEVDSPRAWLAFRIFLAVSLVFLLMSLLDYFFGTRLVADGYTYPAKTVRLWPKAGILGGALVAIWPLGFLYSGALFIRMIARSSGRLRKQRIILFVGFMAGLTAMLSMTPQFLGWSVLPWLYALESAWVVLTVYAMFKYGLFPINLSVTAATVLATTTDAVFAVHPDGTVAYANQSAAKAAGLSLNEVRGQPLSRFISGIDGLTERLARQETEAAGRNGSLVHEGCYLGDGERRIPVSIAISPLPKTDGGKVFICRDVTDLLDKMAQIERQRVHLEGIMSGLGEGVCVVDDRGLVVMVNPVAAKFVGLDSGNVLGRPFEEVFQLTAAADEDAGAFVRAAMTKRSVSLSPVGSELKSANGTLPVVATAAPLYGDESVLGAVVVIRDETREREISRMKSDFVSIASHQLRAPMTAIRWSLELVGEQAGKSLDKDGREALAAARESVARLVRLVNDLLNVSRIERGKIGINPKKADADEFCAKLAKEYRTAFDEKGISLKNEVNGIGEVVMDSRLVYQALANLVSNALKYTPAGGTVTMRGARKGEWFELTVSDSGLGIPEEAREHLFSKFYRASNAVGSGIEGTGLGLFLAKAVVESSGGRIDYETKMGVGTSFTITLPVAGTEAKAGEKDLII